MGFQGPLGWEELAINVHEDIIAQPLGFCMQSGSCLVTDFIWDCFTHSLRLREQRAQFTGRDLGMLSNSPDLGDTEGLLWAAAKNCLSPGYTCLTSVFFSCQHFPARCLLVLPP